MGLISGYSNKSSLNLIFAFVDGILILVGIILGNMIRFGGQEARIFYTQYWAIKAIVIVAVIQISFYYFDLYEFRSLRERTKMGVLLVEAMGISSILLAVVYYTIPSLSIGRGVFLLSLTFIFALAFGWRMFYPWLVSNKLFKERVLIIGTGELAKKISKEINENGQGAFEIVGFVDEERDRIGERIGSHDYRGIQPDLFHLQRREN